MSPVAGSTTNIGLAIAAAFAAEVSRV